MPRNIEGLVVFAILMENGDGIVDKSPEYIMEKYQMSLILEDPKKLLDPGNLRKFEAWLKKWK